MTKHRVHWCSRHEATNFINEVGILGNPGWNMISISDSQDEADRMFEHWNSQSHDKTHKALFLNFQDVDDPSGGFTDQLAQDIASFCADTYVCQQHLLVHCFMGVSRSAAVAKWYSEQFGVTNHSLTYYNLYNKYVYSKLREVRAV